MAAADELSFSKELIHDNVNLHCRYFGDGFRRVLLDRLRLKYEGKCSRYGYINNDSIQLLAVEKITADMHSLKGNIIAKVSFSADVFNPSENSIMRGIVRNVNAAGVLVVVRNDNHDIMSVVVPKHIAILQSKIDLDALQIGMKVQVKIVRQQVEVGQTTLYAVGMIVSGPSIVPASADDVEKPDEHGLLANLEDESIIGDVDVESTSSEDTESEGTIIFDDESIASDSDGDEEEECPDGNCEDAVENADVVSDTSD